ncbi:hypothetical protein EMPG_17247 [Blastomyces silverae]|uniref:Uncharacterized protein n=1 Tax=Blastomyces silverae TaxID=2060906 RepID=A0A0H1BDE6_9EURO|nr:hypothetical protein EMPG_17247 [Blastomyces silverae]
MSSKNSMSSILLLARVKRVRASMPCQAYLLVRLTKEEYSTQAWPTGYIHTNT